VKNLQQNMRTHSDERGKIEAEGEGGDSTK
jgi:hypothetical protein